MPYLKLFIILALKNEDFSQLLQIQSTIEFYLPVFFFTLFNYFLDLTFLALNQIYFSYILDSLEPIISVETVFTTVFLKREHSFAFKFSKFKSELISRLNFEEYDLFSFIWSEVEFTKLLCWSSVSL